jgi:hypothetical protein
VLYLANNQLLIRLSQWISRWEGTPAHLFAAEKRPTATSQAKTVLAKKASAKTGKSAPAPAKGKTTPTAGKTTPAPSTRTASKKRKR